jgi:hypothetical protein
MAEVAVGHGRLEQVGQVAFRRRQWPRLALQRGHNGRQGPFQTAAQVNCADTAGAEPETPTRQRMSQRGRDRSPITNRFVHAPHSMTQEHHADGRRPVLAGDDAAGKHPAGADHLGAAGFPAGHDAAGRRAEGARHELGQEPHTRCERISCFRAEQQPSLTPPLRRCRRHLSGPAYRPPRPAMVIDDSMK